MTPTLETLILTIHDVLTAQKATTAQVEHLRQVALSVIDHDASTADEIREALRSVLDTSQRPNARSWRTDSGIGASRAR